ncbi:MAG: hypothetical protein IPI25_00040 [Candidatus Brocadia sp.]|nr:MAG: hypothetical protein IPI25_00040 [Candidatus Brocadia sp.]
MELIRAAGFHPEESGGSEQESSAANGNAYSNICSYIKAWLIKIMASWKILKEWYLFRLRVTVCGGCDAVWG